jgi:hypothetical protein
LKSIFGSVRPGGFPRFEVIGTQEYFRVMKAVLAIGLNDKCFFKLISDGLVKVDLRMHTKPNGTSRNHGTGFRLPSWESIIGCYGRIYTTVRI